MSVHGGYAGGTCGVRTGYGRGGRATEDESSRGIRAGYGRGGVHGSGGFLASNFQNGLQNGVAHFGGKTGGRS